MGGSVRWRMRGRCAALLGDEGGGDSLQGQPGHAFARDVPGRERRGGDRRGPNLPGLVVPPSPSPRLQLS